MSVFTCRNYIPENAPEVINVDDLPEKNQIGETTEDGIAFQYPEGGGISAMLVRQSDISRLNPSHLRPVDKFLSDTLMVFLDELNFFSSSLSKNTLKKIHTIKLYFMNTCEVSTHIAQTHHNSAPLGMKPSFIKII